jgi:PAS domain S-box-containing protein
VDQQVKILLVEDNPDHAELIKRAFEPFPETHQLSHVCFLEQAKDRLCSLKPDLIIADYQLPDGEGTDLIHLGGDDHPLPIILLTDNGDETLGVSSIKSGILDYIVKSPETFQSLPRIANRAIRQWRTICEHRQAANSLRESQEKLRTVLAHAPVILWTVNRSGLVTYWEGRQYLDNATHLHDMVGRSVYDIFDQYQEIINHFQRAFAGEAFTAQEYMGDRIFETRYQPVVDDKGQPSEIIGVSTDITDREKATQELQRLYAAIEQSDDEIIITNTAGIIKYVNPAYERNMGYKRSWCIGKHVKSLSRSQQEGTPYEDLRLALDKGQSWKGRIADTKKDGTLYYSDAIISPIHDMTGINSGYVWIKRDLTNRLALEKQLIQMQKMEAIGTLANGIAHDFNNILGAIVGYSEVALMATEKDSDLRGYLQRVLQASERAGQLTKQILTFSRQTLGEKIAVQAYHIAREVLQLIRAAIPSNIEIKTDLWSKACVFADPTQLHQILMNLCSNASQAMQPAGGILTIRLHEVSCGTEKVAPFPNTVPGDYLRISVIDTGPGIAPALLDRIFDPFFTTKPPGMGTGLGLSVVNNIVTSYCGFIELDSQVGKGTEFHVYLPICEEEEEPVAEAPQIESVPGGSERILVVDDEPFLTDITEQMLTGLGYRTSTSNDPVSALQMIQKTPDVFDLVITDLTMPHLTGDLLAEEICKIRSDLPIIICTGMSEQLTQKRLKQLGIRSVILKPMVLNQLAKAIRDALEKRKV